MREEIKIQILYRQWGIVLPESNGTDDWTLPIPATFVINRDGRIVLAHLNVDYTQRLEPSDAISAIEQLTVAS